MHNIYNAKNKKRYFFILSYTKNYINFTIFVNLFIFYAKDEIYILYDTIFFPKKELNLLTQ